MSSEHERKWKRYEITVEIANISAISVLGVERSVPHEFPPRASSA